MEGVPAKLLVPATLMQVSLWWWLPYVDIQGAKKVNFTACPSGKL